MQMAPHCGIFIQHERSRVPSRACQAAPHDKYLRLIDAARRVPPVLTAVVHPCDEVSLGGALEARKLGLIDPILVGPPARIHELATRH